MDAIATSFEAESAFLVDSDRITEILDFFDTSFTGKDLLRTRLQALNFNYLSSEAGTNSRLPEGTLGFNAEIDDEDPANNAVTLDTLFYRFNL